MRCAKLHNQRMPAYATKRTGLMHCTLASWSHHQLLLALMILIKCKR